ncbi:ATP-binding protein [Streptomyces sp. YIM 98790]|uniref:ATP-binding protein n=1 Tax=Streptomyces sp. YIM 98790 TaxID=2689077 RepID=UPI00140C9CEC|nr:ATP-binding protein [Streptomyces sp. YIM 98790]
MSVLLVEVVRQCRIALPAIRAEDIGPVRRIVRAHLEMWGQLTLCDLAELGVSELLANVHRHTPGDCELLIREMHDGILVSVTDFDERLPTLDRPDDEAESGRGLYLLSGLVDQMAVEPLLYGKQIWFRLRHATAAA